MQYHQCTWATGLMKGWQVISVLNYLLNWWVIIISGVSLLCVTVDSLMYPVL